MDQDGRGELGEGRVGCRGGRGGDGCGGDDGGRIRRSVVSYYLPF